MTRRRSQSKIKKELPPELLEVVNNLLVNEGLSYQEISDYLKEQGHNISKSSVGRYGKNFADNLQRLQLIREQAKTIVESAGTDSPMVLAEAGNQVAIQMILETLMKVPNLDGEEPMKLIKALGLMERTGTMRERLKLAARKKADEAVKTLEDKAEKGQMKPEDLKYIREVIYGIIE